MRNADHIHTDIDADIVDMTGDLGIKQVYRCLFVKRQAGMGIPCESGDVLSFVVRKFAVGGGEGRCEA